MFLPTDRITSLPDRHYRAILNHYMQYVPLFNSNLEFKLLFTLIMDKATQPSLTHVVWEDMFSTIPMKVNVV